MGILRSDRITGLGGANAISGSVYFTGGTTGPIITISHSQDFAFDTSDFTIEFWIKKQNGSNRVPVFAQQAPSGSSDDYACWIEMNADNTIEFQDQESGAFASTGTIKEDTWTHVAMVRDSNTLRWFIDGVASGTKSESGTMKDSKYSLVIGRWGEGHNANYYYAGYISNLRIQKGVAQYTSAFTPPTNRLEKTPETVLLCCQSSSDVTREETGKILVASAPANGAFPQATHHTPNSPVGFSTTTDVGSQYGSTFDGFGSFATSTYMVPPSGNTRERNRGRGIFHGGYVGPSPGNSYNAQLAAISIPSQGSFTIFGDLTQARYTTTTVGSSTRSIFAGGAIATPSPFASVNTMDFVTIANSSNATDFGDTTSTGFSKSAVSSGTRGVITGGRPYTPSAGNALNTLDLVTIATAGNATDFGDLTDGARYNMMNTAMSPTRGLFGGGKFNSPSDFVNNIELITIATTGNTSEFGDLLVKGGRSGGNCSSNTRGVFSISNYPSSDSISLNFVTIASTGNALDFGDHISTATTKGALSDTIRGIFYGGFDGSTPNYQNVVEQITIATTGNAVDWGEIQLSTGTGRGAYASGISDSHGGLE